MSGNKYTYGDKVEIVNYGNMITGPEGSFDIARHMVGKKGVICCKILTQGVWSYGFEDEDGSASFWYYEDQLKFTEVKLMDLGIKIDMQWVPRPGDCLPCLACGDIIYGIRYNFTVTVNDEEKQTKQNLCESCHQLKDTK